MVEIPTAPEVARRLADALEQAGVPYAVGGAIAYGLHAPPRATNDVDINVFVDADRLEPVFDAFERAGATVDRTTAAESARQRGDFKARAGPMRVDVFVPSIALYASAASRVREAVLLGRPIKVLSAEDLTIFKLLFFRAKDVSDVERLVAFRGDDLDRQYVREWLVALVGVEDERVAKWDVIVGRADRTGTKRP
ncbi:MAG: hypothetical protein HY897_10795 [Deltaproteobacteria bacterium]|nr:hypothetical protein [Deltaproteobacteria bacterium]